MIEPKKDVLKIHFSDNESCDPRIVVALRQIMEEAGVSRPAAARRLMALGCLALAGQDARQAAGTVMRGKARDMWSIVGLLQSTGQGRDSEARSNVIAERAEEFDSSSARRTDDRSADRFEISGRPEPVAELVGLPHAGEQLALSPAAVRPFSDKRDGVSDRAEHDNRMTQPISKLSRVVVKFRDANKPTAAEPNE